MLNPKNDRLDYGSILSPPNNYELDFAIGTTYTLDLDALVGASISLGLSAENDTDLNKNPIFLLEALRSTGDKIALFCEKGQIKLPHKPTPLYILLEEMVFQVTNDNVIKTKYASFHPKIWLIRYINDKKEVLYRFIALSRNLTFDRSWDITFTMDGKKTSGKINKNRPLINFIEYLSKYSSNKKASKMAEIIEELENIKFDLNSNLFEGFEFVVNGIGDGSAIQNHQLFYSKTLENVLIMSPFLSKDVIEDFNERKNPKSKATIITQSMSLGKLKDLDLNNFDIYTVKDEIVDGESILSEDSQQITKQDIHAKMYMVEKTKYTDLYLGSLNASYNALNGNVEFMVKLWARKRRFNIKKALKGIFNGDDADNPFQLVDMSKIKVEVDDGNDLNLVVKGIVRLNAHAKVISNDNRYNIELNFEKDCNKYDIKVKPLLSNKTREFSRKIIFEDLEKTQLSEFFVFCVKNKKETVRRVIKIPVDNLPEDRQKDVVSKVINDKTAFIRYVAFLLGDEYILSSIEESGEGEDGFTQGFTVQLPELYEKMLKSALYAPEKFHELEFLIKTLSGDDVIPEGFYELYNTFKQVIDND